MMEKLRPLVRLGFFSASNRRYISPNRYPLDLLVANNYTNRTSTSNFISIDAASKNSIPGSGGGDGSDSKNGSDGPGSRRDPPPPKKPRATKGGSGSKSGSGSSGDNGGDDSLMCPKCGSHSSNPENHVCKYI